MEQNLIVDRLRDLKSQSLSKMVEEQLEHMILTSEIKPGERINESLLSSTLQISRAPIREACRQLAKHGMVENRVGKGTFVREVILSEAIELYDIRASLDSLAAERACQLADEQGLNGLSALVEKMRVFAEEKDSLKYFSTNLEFHRRIVQLSSNASLMDFYETIFKKLSLFRQKTLAKPDRLQRSLSQHEEIYHAIAAKDAQRAAGLARSHVEEAKEVLLASKL